MLPSVSSRPVKAIQENNVRRLDFGLRASPGASPLKMRVPDPDDRGLAHTRRRMRECSKCGKGPFTTVATCHSDAEVLERLSHIEIDVNPIAFPQSLRGGS